MPFPSFGKRSSTLAYGRRILGKVRGGGFDAAALSLPLTKGITRATAAHAHCSHARSGLLRPGGRRPRRLRPALGRVLRRLEDQERGRGGAWSGQGPPDGLQD